MATYGMSKVSIEEKRFCGNQTGIFVYADTVRWGKHEIMYQCGTVEEAERWLAENGVTEYAYKLKEQKPSKTFPEALEADLSRQIEKDGSRNVKAIIDFLDRWKVRVEEFYVASLPDWIDTLNEYRKADHEYCEWFNHNFAERSNKEIRKAHEAVVNGAKARHAMYKYLDRYVETNWNDHEREYSIDLDLLRKDLAEEAKRKYDNIIERTNEITGTISDASGLSVGNKGELDGIVIGERGTARVHTIGAGGYNIQCFHFRVLVHPVK